MPHDPIRHRAIADNIAARLRCCSILELQVIDQALGTLEGVRERDALGRRWERRIATGPGDVDRSWHLVKARQRRDAATLQLVSDGVETACRARWAPNDATEAIDNPPLLERCGACWREAVQGDALALALIDAVDEIAARERALDEAHERERDEAVPRVVCSTCNDTHRMSLGDREVMCTRCPTPCERCRQRTAGCGAGAYCAVTPCACPCHDPPERPAPAPDVHIGLPGDDLGTPIAVDSDAPAATYKAAIRVLDGGGEAPDELGGGGR